MGWIIFIIYLVCGAFFNLFYKLSEKHPKGSKEKKMCSIIAYVFLGVIVLMVACLIFYAIGWVWYYFCGGFLIFEDQSFLDKVFCGFLSIVLLTFVFGFIAILMGWNPKQEIRNQKNTKSVIACRNAMRLSLPEYTDEEFEVSLERAKKLCEASKGAVKCHARKNHRLPEWRSLCEWIKTLPYANELIICGE